MTTKIADDTASIAQRLKEIEAEKMAQIMGKPLEDPQPTEAPKDLDWSTVYGMYGSPSGFNDAVRQYLSRPGHKVDVYPANGGLTSLAHPAWPYAGTGHEWKAFVKT